MVLDKEKQGNILFPRRNMDFTEMFKKANMDGSDSEGLYPQLSRALFSSTPHFIQYPEGRRVVQAELPKYLKNEINKEGKTPL